MKTKSETNSKRVIAIDKSTDDDKTSTVLVEVKDGAVKIISEKEEDKRKGVLNR